ncbi:helix-turn-helix domain-containing protein (plasmid) [Leptospira sp. WS92.C1]
MSYRYILEKLMKRRGWSQDDLAKAGEVKQPTVSRYLNDQSKPTIAFITNLYKNEKVDPIIFVRNFEKDPFLLDSGISKEEKNNLVEEVTLFIRFIKSSPEIMDIFWKLNKMDPNQIKSINVFADRILEE